MRDVVILGSTGSIGVQALEIIEAKYTKALDDLAIFDPIRLNGRIFYFKPSLPMVVKVGGYIS